MRSLRTLPTIFNCFKYSTYVVVKPDGVSWSAYISLKEKIQASLQSAALSAFKFSAIQWLSFYFDTALFVIKGDAVFQYFRIAAI